VIEQMGMEFARKTLINGVEAVYYVMSRDDYKIHLELDSKLDVEYYARRVCHSADSGAAQCKIRTVTDNCDNDSIVVYTPSFTKVKAAHEAAVPTMSVSRAVFWL
jgi:hypothetical protein